MNTENNIQNNEKNDINNFESNIQPNSEINTSNQQTPTLQNTIVDQGVNMNNVAKPKISIFIKILISICAIALIFTILYFSLFKSHSNNTKDNNTKDNNTNNESNKDSEISNDKKYENEKIESFSLWFAEGNDSSYGFSCLTESGNYYYYGKESNESEVIPLTKLYTNLKHLSSSYYTLMIKEDGTLFYKGLGLEGGRVTEFTEIFKNAKYVSDNNFTIFVIDNNNNLYVRHNTYDTEFNVGVKKSIGEFTKIKENVKQAQLGTDRYFYISMDDKLYSVCENEEKLLMENIKKIESSYINRSLMIMDKENNIYYYKYAYQNEIEPQLRKIFENAKNFNKFYIIDENNNAYYVNNDRIHYVDEIVIEEIKNIKNVYKVIYYGIYYKNLPIEYIDLDGNMHYVYNGIDHKYNLNNIINAFTEIQR